MTIVDTGVWIDFLKGLQTPKVSTLIDLLNGRETIAFTGVVLQELMQGCSKESDADAIELHFSPYVEIFPQRSTYRLASGIYRQCRSRGFTIRSAIDCLVAACAMETDSEVHHQDRDYSAISQVCGLKICNG
jgi:hypothetical protein